MEEPSDHIYFEDFAPGLKFKGRIGRTVTDNDNIWFTLLTNNSNQIHFNADYTKKRYPGEPFRGRMVVNGFFTLATVVGILTEQTSMNGFMLGIENLRFLRPVFSGDTLYAEGEVTETRESRTRSGDGIVRIRSRGRNQRGETIIEFDRIIMMRKRGTTWHSRKKDKKDREGERGRGASRSNRRLTTGA